MLAPGHLAASYLASKIFLKIIKPELNNSEIDNLILWGIIFGVAPDLDLSYNTFHPKKKTVNLSDCQDNESHRRHFTHAPLVWLLASIFIFIWGLITGSSFILFLSLLIWLCSWLHFGLDSLEDGIRWLWPFNKKFFRIKKISIIAENKKSAFLKDLSRFLKNYTKKFKLTFYLEIVLVLAAIIIYFLKI